MDDELTTPEEENHQIGKQKKKQIRRRSFKKKSKTRIYSIKKSSQAILHYINVIWTRSLNIFLSLFHRGLDDSVVKNKYTPIFIHRLWSGLLWHDINLFETEIPKVLSMAVEKISCVLRKTRQNCQNGNWKVIQTISVYN